MPTAYQKKSKVRSSGLYLEVLLLVLIVASLAATSLPALKHFNKRQQYREITEISVPVISAVEKCLGMLRVAESCDTEDELIAYGGVEIHAKSSSLIEKIEINYTSDLFELIFTPPESNQVSDFITDEHTLIKLANVVYRNDRPIIEDWETDPKSGCMISSLC